MKHAADSLEYHFMPFTSNRDFKREPRLYVKGEGVHYWTHDGRRILDGSSGLFCVAAGHGRQEIATAVYEQLLELDYGPPFQGGHPGQFELARLVAQHTPDGLDRIFFVNSGSDAVDTALEMALAYHRARGEGTRMRMVSRECAYHGVNVGGTSLSGMVKNREAFGIRMGAVAVADHIYDALMDAAPEGAVEFFHGYTYSGHPAACAAGIAMMGIFERERLFERAAELAPYFLDAVFSLADVPAITDIRGYGLLAGIDLAPDGNPGARGMDAHKRLHAAGLYVKMTGDAAILAPPLVSDRAHIDETVGILREVLSAHRVLSAAR